MPEAQKPSSFLQGLIAQENYQRGRNRGASLARTLTRAMTPPMALSLAMLRGVQVAQERAPEQMKLLGALFQKVLAGEIKVDQGLKFMDTMIDWPSFVPKALEQGMIFGVIAALGLTVGSSLVGVTYRWVTEPKD